MRLFRDIKKFTRSIPKMKIGFFENSESIGQKGEKKVNAKSIMGIMSLAIAKGTVVVLMADGDDAQTAVDSLSSLIQQED